MAPILGGHRLAGDAGARRDGPVTSTEAVLPNRPRRGAGGPDREVAVGEVARLARLARTSMACPTSLGCTSTTVSARSLAVIRMSPAGIDAERDRFGCANVGMAASSFEEVARTSSCRTPGSANPAGERGACARRSVCSGGAGPRRRGRDGGGGGPHQPGVDRHPVAPGGLLDAGLELSESRKLMRAVAPSRGRRHASAPAGAVEATPAGTARRTRRGHHEARVAAAQAQLDRAGREIPGDLVGRRGQRVEQGQPGRRLQWPGQPLGQGPGVGAAGSAATASSRRRLSTYGVNPWHHYDTTMVPSQGESSTRRRRRATGSPPPAVSVPVRASAAIHLLCTVPFRTAAGS